MKDYKDKLNKEINYHLNNVKKSGSSKLSTCDHYNWDKDIWNHRHTIINKLRDEGLNVSSQMNWGILDITIVASDPWTYPGTVATVEDEKDARLIAAAPAMYEVLQELAESMELAKNYGYEKEHAMIQEVLAKVEGGEG